MLTKKELEGILETLKTPDTDASWKVLVSFLYFKGIHTHDLSQDEYIMVRTQADGFGPGILPEQKDIFWDWSHVRDSSAKGVRNMASVLDTVLRKKYAVLLSQPAEGTTEWVLEMVSPTGFSDKVAYRSAVLLADGVKQYALAGYFVKKIYERPRSTYEVYQRPVVRAPIGTKE